MPRSTHPHTAARTANGVRGPRRRSIKCEHRAPGGDCDEMMARMF